MTSNEILKADVLDILFENRNKSYGAYALRKEYDKRLLLSLMLALSSLFLFWLLSNAKQSHEIHNPRDVGPVVIHDLPIPPEPPKPPQAPRVRPTQATQQFTNQIQFVKNNIPPDVPDINILQTSNIGTTTIDGPPADGLPQAPAVNAPPAPVTTTERESEHITIVERQPEFPGGIKALADFISRNLVTPGEMEAGEKKTVYVKFVVNEDGTVTQFEVVKSAGTMYDKEVLRVMKKMPKWKPAIQNGKNVTVAFTQPVTFQTVEE